MQRARIGDAAAALRGECGIESGGQALRVDVRARRRFGPALGRIGDARRLRRKRDQLRGAGGERQRKSGERAGGERAGSESTQSTDAAC